jgi:hypothetical protein
VTPAPPPPPTATTDTDVTPAGATQVNVPPEYTIDPGAAEVVIELLAELADPVPIELVAVTVNV